MKPPLKLLLPTLFLTLLGVNNLSAQSGSNYVKLGTSVFFLTDAQVFNHTFLSLEASYEYQFSRQFSINLNISAARLVGDAQFNEIDGFIRNTNSAEMEWRFYPNSKGKGFYAGVSALLYQDRKVIAGVPIKFSHFGSHINVGVQFPMANAFYLQVNGQIGIYGQGYSTISRYGLKMMVGYRF